MTTVAPPIPTQTIVDCGDTPLSTTASIVGILTFALGLLASYVALQTATRGAPTEISRLVDELRSTQAEINRVAEYIFDDAHYGVTENIEGPALRVRFLGAANPPYATDTGSSGLSNGGRTNTGVSSAPLATMTPLDALYSETQTLLSSCIKLFYETDRVLKRSKSDYSRWDPEGLRRRIVFVMNRHKVDEKIQRLAEQKQKLGSVQMSLFMRKSVAQDALLRDMKRQLESLEKRMARRSRSDSEEDSGVSANG